MFSEMQNWKRLMKLNFNSISYEFLNLLWIAIIFIETLIFFHSNDEPGDATVSKDFFQGIYLSHIIQCYYL